MSKKKSKKTDRKFGTFWTCLHCDGIEGIEHKAMMEHMKTVHGINSEKAKGSRRLNMHLDGDTWFSSRYDWEINGLKFIQETVTRRTGMNLAMWSGDGE